MKPKYKRLIMVVVFLITFLVGSFLLLINLRNNLVFFYSPTEILEKRIPLDKKIRVGGLIKKKSLNKKITVLKGKNVEEINFIITDYNNEIFVTYIGILPDLFKEGQGVVSEGFLKNKSTFFAKKILAKHDENYMPPEVVDKIFEKEKIK